VYAELVALHLGALHPYEKVLTLVLAFGPFLVLGAVIAVRRRHEEPDDRRQEEPDDAATPPERDHPAAR
jgi:hypothetical protein